MSAENLKRITYELARPEGRMVGTLGHDRARAMLVREMADLGLQPYAGKRFELPYEHQDESFTNLAGVLPGRNPDLLPVVIVGHYDSILAGCCADDNATAVAIGLETIRQLKDQPLDRPVVLLLPDAEEPPYYHTEAMGSVRFYEDHMAGRGAHAAIVMDLVGHDIQVPGELLPKTWLARFPGLKSKELKLPRLRRLLAMTGAESHPHLAALVEQTAVSKELLLLMTPNKNVGDMSDHGIFRQHGVPYLFLSCGQWLHYHTVTDTPDRLNYDKMDAITRYVIGLVRSLAGAVLSASPVPESDTVRQEIACLRRIFGATLPLFLRVMGVEKVETRQDLDTLARRLVNLGL